MGIGFLVFAIISSIIIYKLFRFIESDFSEALLNSVIAIVSINGILLFLLGMAWTFIDCGCSQYKESEEVYKEAYEIYSLENTTKFEGSFILGTGEIKNDYIVYYFLRKGEYGYTIDSIKPKYAWHKIYIQESDEETPKVKHVYEKKYYTGKYEKWLGKGEVEEFKATVIVVPKNTIKLQYNVDLNQLENHV